MFNTKLFAERLKNARAEKHISQAELAKAVGVSAATISSYETPNGTKIPSLDKAAALASELGVSIDWLCGKGDTDNVKISDYDTETFLRALVVVLSEMTTECRTVDNSPTICIGNSEIGKFISQVQDVVRVYHNGTLSTDLYEACIERIISNYGEYTIFGSRFLSNFELSAVSSSLMKKINEYGANSIKQGTISVTLFENPLLFTDYEIFLSEKTLEEYTSYIDSNKGGD